MKYMSNISVSASITGFENPTIPFLEKILNLDEILIPSPSSSRLIKSPNQLQSVGISKGDWLIVNASLNPTVGDAIYVIADDICGVTTYKKAATTMSQYESVNVVGVIQHSIHFYRGSQDIPEHSTLKEISIHEMLVDSEHSTVLAKASGKSMMPHLFDGDLMLIERHLNVLNEDVCVLALNGDLVLKRIDLTHRILSSDNPSYKPHHISSSDNISNEGVVNKVIRLHRTPCSA